MIPFAQISLTEPQKERLVGWLERRLHDLGRSRSVYLKERRKDDAAYHATPKGQKTFPWRNAANVRLPIPRIHADSISGRLKRSIRSPRPAYFTLQPTTEGILESLPQLQRSFENLARSPFEMDMESFISKMIPLLVRRGSAPARFRHISHEKKIAIYDRLNPSEDPKIEERSVMNSTRPVIRSHERFVCDPSAPSLQDSDIVGEEIPFTEMDIKMREQRQHFAGGSFETIKSNPDDRQLTDEEKEQRQREGFATPINPTNTWTIHSLHITFDVFDDAQPWDLEVDFHLPTRTILSLTYNRFEHGMKDFILPPYRAAENTLFPTGVVGRLRPMALAIDTVINQTLDAATLANAPFFLQKMNEPGLGPMVDLFPGVSLELQDMEALKIEQVRPQFAHNPAVINIILSFMEQDSGVDAVKSGGTSALKSDQAATSVLAALQESNQGIDTTLDDLRLELGMGGLMALINYQQFRPDGFSFTPPEDVQLSEGQMEWPDANLLGKVAVHLTATTAAMDRQAKIQNAVALTQMISGYYQLAIPLGQQWLQARQMDPALGGIYEKALTKMADAYANALETFDQLDAADYRLDPETILGTATGDLDISELGALGSVAGATALPPAGGGSVGLGEPFNLNAPAGPEEDLGGGSTLP